MQQVIAGNANYDANPRAHGLRRSLTYRPRGARGAEAPRQIVQGLLPRKLKNQPGGEPLPDDATGYRELLPYTHLVYMKMITCLSLSHSERQADQAEYNDSPIFEKPLLKKSVSSPDAAHVLATHCGPFTLKRSSKSSVDDCKRPSPATRHNRPRARRLKLLRETSTSWTIPRSWR